VAVFLKVFLKSSSADIIIIDMVAVTERCGEKCEEVSVVLDDEH